MNLLTLVPLQYRAIAILVMIASVFGYGWTQGAEHQLNKQAIIDSQKNVKILQARIKQAEITEKVVTRYVDKIRIIKKKGDTIISQVPVYITQENDNNCTVPESFSLLWNTANRGDIPETTRTLNETPSAIVLSDIAAQHATEASICRETEQQLVSLQDWIKAQE